MKCKSASSTNADGYRAGVEIGETLCPIEPEVVILFSSIAYCDQFPDLFDGLYDGLNTREVIVFGGTSDGVYETDQVFDNGITALALNSEGKVQWTAELEPKVDQDAFEASKRCAERVSATLKDHIDFAFVCADGIKADGTQVVKGVSRVIKGPFIGALTGDDRKFTRSFMLLNGEAYQDAVAILAARGPIRFAINSNSGWSPTGETGIIEACSGVTIDQISGVTPQQFFRNQLGKLPGETDLGMAALASYHANGAGNYALRTPSNIDEATGAATMFGSLEKGTEVRVCSSTLKDVLNGVDEAMSLIQKFPFEPAGALVISCAGRRWLLEERSCEEVARVLKAVGKKIPLAGFPSFGEMGPFIIKEDGRYTPTFFHNVTFVVCLFGE
jgi:hypothetical protein